MLRKILGEMIGYPLENVLVTIIDDKQEEEKACISINMIRTALLAK